MEIKQQYSFIHLKFPSVSDHEVEVGVLVDGGRDAAVVVQELG